MLDASIPVGRLPAQKTAQFAKIFSGGLELTILLLLLVVVVMAGFAGDPSSAIFAISITGPGVAFALLSKAFGLLRSDSRFLFSPMVWLRLAASVYCGFGTFVPIIATPATKAYIRTLYDFTPQEHLHVTGIYLLGLILLLLYTRFWSWILQKAGVLTVVTDQVKFVSPSLKLIIALLVFGGVLRYGVALPVALGLTSSTPGVLIQLSRVFYVGLFLISLRSRTGSTTLQAAALLILTFDVAISIATFSKMEVLMGVIFYQLGRLLHRSSVTELVRTVIIISLTYFMFQPVVHFGREHIMKRYGADVAIGIVERWGILSDYIGDSGARSENGYNQGGAQLGLLRLSYVSADAFVIHRADQGLYRNTLQHALAAVVPRVLWPGKPEIWREGIELNYLIFNSLTTSVGVTLFAEMYWVGGLVALFLVSFLPALILCVYSHISWNVVSQGRWLLFPVVFIGINIAVRVDGYIVLDFIGPATLGLVMYPILALTAQRQ